MAKNPKVELSIPIIPDMELAATQTSEVVARHMGLSQDQSDEIKMALIEACINSEKIGFNIFYGVSDNKWKIWDISDQQELLNFHPESNAEIFRKQNS